MWHTTSSGETQEERVETETEGEGKREGRREGEGVGKREGKSEGEGEGKREILPTRADAAAEARGRGACSSARTARVRDERRAQVQFISPVRSK